MIAFLIVSLYNIIQRFIIILCIIRIPIPAHHIFRVTLKFNQKKNSSRVEVIIFFIKIVHVQGKLHTEHTHVTGIHSVCVFRMARTLLCCLMSIHGI